MRYSTLFSVAAVLVSGVVAQTVPAGCVTQCNGVQTTVTNCKGVPSCLCTGAIGQALLTCAQCTVDATPGSFTSDQAALSAYVSGCKAANITVAALPLKSAAASSTAKSSFSVGTPSAVSTHPISALAVSTNVIPTTMTGYVSATTPMTVMITPGLPTAAVVTPVTTGAPLPTSNAAGTRYGGAGASVGVMGAVAVAVMAMM